MAKGLHMYLSIGLREDMVFRTSKSGTLGTVSIGDDQYGNTLVIHGTPDEFRRVAEQMYELADQMDRAKRRQRALDNPPRSRRKFVLEGDKVSTHISEAA